MRLHLKRALRSSQVCQVRPAGRLVKREVWEGPSPSLGSGLKVEQLAPLILYYESNERGGGALG